MNDKYNDLELLYLISEGDEEAKETLIEKYIPLINKRIKAFNIKYQNQDDFRQEGMMVLLQAINSYDESKNKSFTNYFDMILQMRFGRILKNEYNYFYNVSLVEDSSYIKPDLADSFEFKYEDSYYDESLSELELKVKNLYVRGYKPKEISKELQINIKSVYNTICRLKLKKENMQ